ncbi:MAG: extracellular solute-binding protein [Planctomycetota bacterium]|nr:extracellular solute-binding protein [Planctomycetota bacterium]
MMSRSAVCLALALSFLGLACGKQADVVLYCAVDRAHSEPVVRAFEKATGLVVDFQPDIELSKSVGHRRRLQEEAHNPRCDVFWNNEVVQTVMLSESGLLQPYESPNAQDIPSHLKGPQGLWTGFGARARVLIANITSLPDPSSRPNSTRSFLDPKWKSRAGMAKPLTGTTAAQGSIWIQKWGLAETLELLTEMSANEVAFGPGNAHLMKLVREGKLAFGWTDTDDAKVAIDGGYPVVQIVPDQGPEELGLIVIPNTVAMIAGAPHPDAAKLLIDFLLSPQVEEMLAYGPSAQIPVRPQIPRPPTVLDLSDYKVAEIDWQAVGSAYGESVDALENYFNQ